tara:strand:+ start:1607 stop:1891 length:285 start_codon:yes stop_codon:yes gene_type:complete
MKQNRKKTKHEELIDVLLEERRKLSDFKKSIKDSIERNVARDLNDDEILMAVEKITFDRSLAEADKIEDGHISLEDWRKKQNKLFRLGVNPYNV